MNLLLAAAYKYISNGVCVIPTNYDKIPVVPWKQYQDILISMEEAEKNFELPYAAYLGIVCGKSSKNLEVIDIDVKYDQTGKLFDSYVQDIKDNDPELYNSLLIVATKNKGFHLYYRCEIIEGNQKLARRVATEEELAADRNDKIKVLIETRGQGGYVVAPPSNGYKIIQGEAIPIITVDQRDMLLELARSYNQVVEEPKREYNTTATKEYFTAPWDDYNSRGDIIPLLQQHGWQIVKETSLRIILRRPGKKIGVSGDYHKEKKLFKVFTTSSVFEEGQGYSHYRVFKVLECNNDPKLAGRKLLEMGYGEKRVFYGDALERQLFKKKQEGLTNEQLIQSLMTDKEKKTEEEAKEIVTNLNKIWGEKLCTFWEVDDRGKATINRASLINFLFANGGFALFYYDSNSTIYRVVQCKDGFLQEATSEYMKKFIMDYIDHLPDSFDGGITPDDLKALLLKGHDTYFSSGMLEFLPRGQYDLLKDDIESAYFPFKNGVIKVTKESIGCLTYSDVNRVVWKTQIIDFDIKIDEDINNKAPEYAEFIFLIAGEDESRYNYARTLIGYLLHKYKDPGKPYCVILAEENDNETKGGGTGKGIYLTAISKLINTERVDGKNFKLDKNFAFQRVGLDTRLVAIEDTRKNVDFEGFYSIITEGITVEKKNKDELFIPYKDSPKIVFTTNYTIVNSGAHAQRRQRTFEFAPFFGVANTPATHFKHNLFDDWDRDEWNMFYNYLFQCVQQYLKEGILEQQSTLKVKRKHIKLKYGEEFLEWFDSYLEQDARAWKFIGDLYEEFINSSGSEKKFFSQKRFRMAINEWTGLLKDMPSSQENRVPNHGIIVEERRLRLGGKRVEIRILKNGEKGQDVEEKDTIGFS